MKNILVPTDFSEEAKNATTLAIRIAEKTNAKITLLNVIDFPDYLVESDMYSQHVNSLDSFIGELNKESSEKLKLEANKISQNVPVDPITSSGVPYNVITDKANELNADLIVMGTKGSSGLSEWIIGSNTEKIVRNSSIPVVAVPENEHDFTIKHIAFAYDFTAKENIKNISLLTSLADALGAELHFLRVCTPQHFESTPYTEHSMELFAKKNNIKTYTPHIYNYPQIEEGIFNFVKDNQIDMIAMATHGRKGIAHLFMGSKTEDIVNHSKNIIITFQTES